MRIGAIELHSLSDGFFGLDGGAMFGVIPRPLWERTNPPDERNRIRLALRPLLIVCGKERLLVDTGIGDKWDAKNTDIYRIEHTDTIESSLARAGLRPEQVTKVVLTHLHFDHAGGATKLGPDVKPVPRFANARYYVQQKEWNLALNPNRRSRAAYLPDNFLPLQETGQLELVDGDLRLELAPGVTLELMLTGGHTPGHQIVTVTNKSEVRNQKPEFETAAFWGDLIPTRSHIATPYIMGYDLLPLETMEQKEKLVQQAVAGRWLSFLEHDPDFASGFS